MLLVLGLVVFVVDGVGGGVIFFVVFDISFDRVVFVVVVVVGGVVVRSSVLLLTSIPLRVVTRHDVILPHKPPKRLLL